MLQVTYLNIISRDLSSQHIPDFYLPQGFYPDTAKQNQNSKSASRHSSWPCEEKSSMLGDLSSSAWAGPWSNQPRRVGGWGSYQECFSFRPATWTSSKFNQLWSWTFSRYNCALSQARIYIEEANLTAIVRYKYYCPLGNVRPAFSDTL